MISPAIHLPGNCAEAIALYQKAFHMTLNSISYYRDVSPDSGMRFSEDERDKVMHAELTICGSRVNMSDGDPKEIVAGNIIVLNVFLASDDDVRKAFHILEESGKIVVELGPQFWTSMYCSVEDRFGIRWQLMTE